MCMYLLDYGITAVVSGSVELQIEELVANKIEMSEQSKRQKDLIISFRLQLLSR